MIQKLRMKFIGIFMGSLMLVIVLVMGLLNFLNYREAIQSADNILDILAENDGSFPPPRQPQEKLQRNPPRKHQRGIGKYSTGAGGFPRRRPMRPGSLWYL